MSQRIPEIPKHIVNDYSHDLLLARLSHVAYADRTELNAAMNAGFRKPEFELPPNWRPLLDQPFGHVDTPLTGFAATVFREQGSGNIVIAYRGSDDAQDWKGPNTKVAMDGPILNTVMEIANPLGTPSGERVQKQLEGIQKQLLEGVFDASNDQFSQALKLVSDVRQAYPDARIEVTGHSLGGALAQVAAHTYGLPGRSFDAPGAANIIESEGYQEWLSQNGLRNRIAAPSRETTGERQSEDRDQFINYKVNDSIVSQMTGPHLGNTDSVTALGGRQSVGDYAKYAGDKAADLIGAIPLVGKVKRLGDSAEWAQMYIQAVGNGMDVTEKHDMERIVRVFSTAVDKGELQRWGQESDRGAPSLVQQVPATTAPSLPSNYAPSRQQAPDVLNPEHPGHDAFREMRHKVSLHEAGQGIPHGEHTDRVAAALLHSAVEHGIPPYKAQIVKDPTTGQTHLLDRRDPFQSENQCPRVAVDVIRMSSQPIDTSTRRLDETVSPHNAAPARSQERTQQQSQALAGLGFEDQVMFARIRRDVPGHVSDDHVGLVMRNAKQEGLHDAGSIGTVMMIGDQLYVRGRGEAAKDLAVDVTRTAPTMQSSVEATNTLNEQRLQRVAQQQNNPAQDDPGAKGPRLGQG